jgi:uncharacterized protein Yka (UPF0111/DUF47 family)
MSHAQMIFSIIASSTIAMTGIFAAVRHLVKSYLHELIPNHGTSIKDKINHLEQRIDDIYRILLEKQ